MDNQDVELYYEVFKAKKFVTLVYNKNIVWVDLYPDNNILIELIQQRKDTTLGIINLTNKQITLYEDTPLTLYLLPLINKLLSYE